MNDQQWNTLLDTIKGKDINLPIGFIIDSPWLPNWYGITKLDYYTSDELWFNANMRVINEFPECMFLPGFWSEYGMCGEPSAFGAKGRFPEDEFPHAFPCINSVEEIDNLEKPGAGTDGLPPFILNRLKLNQGKIESKGYKIRFSVSRGPLNVASYLMGSTEFLMALISDPERIHALLRVITDYLKEWHAIQMETFSSIDGMLVLDDIVGFIGEEHFREFALPYFKELYEPDVSVKFFHNDAPCKVSAPYLPEIGVNLFNMGFDITLNELKELTNNKVTLVGNIPPRDILAQGSPEDVERSVTDLIHSLNDRSKVVLSCGGGMPPGVTSENLCAFIETVERLR
jgi:uroporphyrinogen decarboxylase